MKVDNLLGPYLYQFKKLSLPGIGLFTLDDKAVLPDDNAKVKLAIEGLSFNAKTGTQLDDSLIQFIKEQTGKMKALAEADLYSYIATAFQFLNIGKPFYFEGIGTLQKNKDGAYTFTAGTVLPQKTEEPPARYSDTSKKSTYNSDAEAAGSNRMAPGKVLVVLGVLVTLALIAWGGYFLYTKNTTEGAETAKAGTPPLPAPDTASAIIIDSSGKKPADSASQKGANAAIVPPVKTDTGQSAAGYKFILEITDKKARAVKRYTQLKGVTVLKTYNNQVAMETNDSVSFKIYTLVACLPADTGRVKASLNAWYYGTTPIKVKIEP